MESARAFPPVRIRVDRIGRRRVDHNARRGRDGLRLVHRHVDQDRSLADVIIGRTVQGMSGSGPADRGYRIGVTARNRPRREAHRLAYGLRLTRTRETDCGRTDGHIAKRVVGGRTGRHAYDINLEADRVVAGRQSSRQCDTQGVSHGVRPGLLDGPRRGAGSAVLNVLRVTVRP